MYAFAIIAAIAAVVSAVSAIAQGDQQRRIANYNADLAERAAKEKRQQAEFQADRQREQGEALKARQRLLFNVSGVTAQGTPTDLMVDTSKKLELDALAIQYGGQSAGTALELQGQLQKMQGSAANNAGWWNAGSSLLSGASSIAGKYAFNGGGGTVMNSPATSFRPTWEH